MKFVDDFRKRKKPEVRTKALGQKKRCEIICRCNNVNRDTIEQAIRDGAHSMNEIFDATCAGVGPCGGSCRRKLKPMLDHFLATGTFPEKIQVDMTGKCDKIKIGEE